MERENLPELLTGWVEIQLGDIVYPSDEKVEPLAIQEIPYIGLEHIEKDTGKLLGIGKSNEVRSTKSKFYSGDLLYGKLRPYLNKVYLANFDGVCSTDILVFSKNSHISNDYLAFRFLCRDFVSYASQNVNGVQHPRVNFQTLAEFPIALPPLNEQRRIVAKIETLKARSQQVKEAIEAIPPLLERFRQSVLAAAFRGDLTADWREKNPDVEPAPVLLERIRVERRRRWEEAQLEKMKASGKTLTNDKWKSKYKEPTSVDARNLHRLPDKWCWATLDELMHKIVDGTHHTPTYVEDGVAFLSVKDIRDEKIHFDDCKYISQEQHEKLCERCHPEPGDLLITKSGTIGRCAVVKTDRPFSLFVSVALLKPATPEVLASFVSLAFQAWFQNINVQNDVTGSAIKNFHLIDFRELALPVPPLEEQHQIIAEVKASMYRAKAIQSIIGTCHNTIGRLDQSILSKAFRGELVPQDPNDEPASILLEHIRAEREKREAEAKAAKKSTGKTTGRRSRKVEQQDSESIQLDLPGVE